VLLANVAHTEPQVVIVSGFNTTLEVQEMRGHLLIGFMVSLLVIWFIWGGSIFKKLLRFYKGLLTRFGRKNGGDI
jgi:hypothetical protein